VLSRGLMLAGVVKDGEGKPVAGAEVRINQTQLFRGGRGGVTAQLNFIGNPIGRERVTTGPDGRFEFKGLTGGDYLLVATKPGFSDGTLDPVKVSEGGEPVELVVNAGASISGSVVDSVGVPAEGFVVQARPRTGGGGGLLRMAFGGNNRNVTGPDGSFVLEGLQVGESYDLSALGAEGPEAQQPGVKAPSDGVQLVVPGRGKIAGRILDAANGQPVSDFEIGFNPDRSGRGAGGMVVRFGGAGGRRGAGQRDQVHAEDGAYLLDDVPPGTWEINVDARSYQAGRVGGIVVEPGQTKEGVVIKLSRGSAIRGRVIDGTTSRPVPDVRVTADVAGGQGRPPMLDLLNGAGGIPTDADGAFEVDGLSQGRYLVTATHPDYAEASQLVEVKEGLAAAELRIQAGGVLGGVVISEARRALPGVQVVLEPSGEGGGLGGRRGPFADTKGTVSDASGHFRFDHLTGGRYRLVASLRNRSSSPLEAVLQPSEVKDDVQLALQAGATVHGTVTGLGQSARGNVNVTATGPESYFASVRAGADASFVLEGVPAGTINLRATVGDFLSGNMRSAAGQVTVPEGELDAQAEIAFETGFSLTGSITRAGQPVGNATVSANPRGGGGSSAMSRSDSSGNYDLEGLQQGTYMVSANAAQGGSHAQQVQIAGDQTLDIQIPVARLAGTVVEAGSKQPLSDVRVQAQRTPGAGGAASVGFAGGGSSTDSNGRFAIEDLEAVSYTLTATRAEYVQNEKPQVTAADQGTDELVIEMQRGEGIGIVARDGIYGIPLHGLNARVLTPTGAPVGGPVNVALDSDGRGEIPSIKPGQYVVTASASGYAPATFAVTVPSPLVSLAMTPGGNIEIHAGPTAIAQGWATLLDASGRPYSYSDQQSFGPGFFVSTNSPRITLNAPTRLLQHLPPGRYSLALSGQHEPQSFSVAEGQTTGVTLP
jgi:protocatechuate 3,4-dioxygenase beta subunit